MYELEKKKIIDAALKLDKYQLISLSGGNVSLRVNSEHILVTPSGMVYDEMVPEDVLVVDNEGKIVEGERKASVDTIALCYIYKNMPNVNSIIHTHQPYVTIGKNLTEALYAAVYLEESAKTLYVAHSLGRPVAKLTEDQIQVAVDVFKTYGQVPGEH